MANRKLGIHIAPGSLKVVEVEPLAKNFVLHNYSVDYFPSDNAYLSHAKALIGAIKKKGMRAKEAHLVISGGEIIYKLVELPPLPEKETGAALHFKVKNLLPANYKEVVLDYYKLDKISRPGKQLYFVAISPKENMLAVTKMAKAAGCQVPFF